MQNLINLALKAVLYPFFQQVIYMPGKSYLGSISPLNHIDEQARDELKKHIIELSENIGDRSLKCPQGLEAAAAYIESSFVASGFKPRVQTFTVNGQLLKNIEVVVPGTENPQEILVIGAHYDTVPGTPGADDNASGVAALLYLAKEFFKNPQSKTIRFVAFANEETYDYENMGSYVYAKRCSERKEQILGMISLEMLGYYSNEKNSQKYPFPFSLFYPDKGNFIAFVGSLEHRAFLHKTISAFRQNCKFPSEGCATPKWVSDASRSDHLSFWIFKYPALMVTDTSNFRFKLYHTKQDRISLLNLDHMTRAIRGLVSTVEVLTRS